MRRALKLVLVITALLGLFGQTVAVAASPGVATTIDHTAPSTMPADCLAMMKGVHKGSLPCGQMTLACLAGMGCATVVALDVQPTAITVAPATAVLPVSPPFRALHGRSVQPEPHPPSTLA